MKQKYLVKPEIEAEIIETIFVLFKNGCPICVSDDGTFEDSAYNLPNEYREMLLSSLYKYEGKDVALSIGNTSQFMLKMIDRLSDGTKVYWVHDLWRTKEILVIDDLPLAKECVKNIIECEFSLEPTCYEGLERKIYVRQDRISRLKNTNNEINSLTIMKLQTEIDALQKRLEDRISNYEDCLNNSFAIETLVVGYKSSKEKLLKYLSPNSKRISEAKKEIEKYIYNPNLKLNRKRGTQNE